MGVDQKRPLVGFAFVAVLCAILMTVSVGRGWADVFQPGKPIAAAALGGPVDREPAPQPSALEDDAEISIPVELSAQPLGVAVGAPASRESVATSGAGSASGSASGSTSRTTEPPAALRLTARGTADRREARQADKADRKATRQAEKADRKAARQAEKADRKGARKAAKAAYKAARKASKAARKAGKAARRA